MLDWCSKTDGKELALGLMLLVQLWYARNEAREAVSVEDPESTVRRALFLTEEWDAAKPSTQMVAAKAKEKWSPPMGARSRQIPIERCLLTETTKVAVWFCGITMVTL
jgi:hypothetical protein